MIGGLAYQPAKTTDQLTQNQCQHFSRKTISESAIQSLQDRITGPDGFGHLDVLQANTGWGIDVDKWAKRRIAADKLDLQTKEMADSLERMGEKARLDSGLTIIGAVSERVEELPVYRAIRILPSVAARERRKYLNSLKYMIAKNRNSRYFRYAVFTCEELIIEGGDLRGTIQGLSRRISRWSSWANEKYAIEVLFRGIEFTRATAAERDDEAAKRYREENPAFVGDLGTPLSDRYGAETVLYHVHANVLYWPHRIIEDWTVFLEQTHKRSKAMWRDNGVIEKAEELVKYCFKPNELKKASDKAILWLFYETTKLKICQPMGSFKKFVNELERARDKIVRVNIMGNGKYCRVKKSRKLDHSKTVDDADTKEPQEAIQDDRECEQKSESCQKPKNMVLGVTLPQWRHMAYAEPMILVQWYDPSAQGDADQERYREIEALKFEARENWEAAQAPDVDDALRAADIALCRQAAAGGDDGYKVHTCSSTVQLGSEPIPDLQQDHETVQEGNLTTPLHEQEMEIPRKDRAAIISLAAEAIRRSGSCGTVEHLRAVAAHYSNSYPDVDRITEAELMTAVSAAPLWIAELEAILPGRWLSDQEVAAFRPRMAA